MTAYVIIGLVVLLALYLINDTSSSSNPAKTDDDLALNVIRRTEKAFEKVQELRHPYPADFLKAVQWSHKVLSRKQKYVILDSETMGLTASSVVVQLGIIDIDGNTLFDSLVKPTKRKRMSKEAEAIHGISMTMLKDAPTLKDLQEDISRIVEEKIVLIFNAAFDKRLLDQTCEQDGIENFQFYSTQCVMLQYSKFIGDWSAKKYDYTYQKLPGGDHTAIGDCRATLDVVKEMASYYDEAFATVSF